MADVVISYSRENEATARLLSDTLAKDGYEVWRDESAASSAASADAIAEQIGRAKAVIVLWSESAIASEWVRAEANVARGMKKLVQASADDRPPPIPFDPANMASISTWLGDPGHPGWQQLRAGIEALCGTPDPDKTVLSFSPVSPPAMAPASVPAPPPPAAVLEAAVPSPPPVTPAAPASSPPQVAPAAAAPAGRGKGGLIAAVLILLAILGGGGYWAWQQGWINVPGANNAAPADELTSTLPPGPGAPTAPATETAQPPAPTPVLQPTDPTNEMAAAEEQFTQESVVRNADGFAFVRSAPGGEGLTIARINAGEIFTTYPQDGDWWRVRTASGATGYMAASSIRARAAMQAEPRATEERRRRPTGPRINRANSANMRLFCQNAGQGTPQCRRFRQQVRNQQR